MNNQVETVIIGGGQSGLAVSYFLKQVGHEHLIIDAAEKAAHAWRDDRWDSFTLVTPNWAFRLPGAEYAGPNPHGYMDRIEVVGRFESYIDQHNLPVHCGVRALSVASSDSGYRVDTNRGLWEAKNVVIAAGLYQKPKIPDFSAEIPSDTLQLSSGQYRNPKALPPGAVLVAGSGQSGCQIAEELYKSGRKVYLCIGSAGRAPRRYRERDIFEWLHLCGFFDRTPDKLPSPRARFAGNPQVSGKNGGHTLDLHQFFRDGVVLLGRLQGAREGDLFLAQDLKENLAKVDAFEINLLKLIDDFISKQGIPAPVEHLPTMRDGFSAPEPAVLNLKDAGILTVIWALGYSFDFSWIRLPVFDEFGFPVTDAGVTSYPGLHFAGLPWLPGQKTGLLLGVGSQTAQIAAQISGR